MRAPHRDAGRVISGTFWIALGQLGGVAAGLFTAILLPRSLGPTDYGEWILLRGIMSLAVCLSTMGTPEIIARFYIARIAEGKIMDAARVFKFVAMIRLLLSGLVVVAFWNMASGKVNTPGGSSDLVFLSFGTFFQVVTTTLVLQLFGQRDFRRLAIYNTLQPALVPLMVLLAHHHSGFPGIPAAVALGDAGCLLLVTLMTLKYWVWADGWPTPEERKTFLQFGGTVGLASLGFGVFQIAIPYLLKLMGYEVEAIGFVGMAQRLAGLVVMAMAAMGSGLFSSLNHILHTDGESRMLRWHDLGTRAGLIICLAVSGVWILVSPWLVPFVFGTEYTGAVPVVSIGMLVIIPFWLGGQLTRLSLLLRTTVVPVVMVITLYGILMLLLWGLPRNPTGLNAGIAMVTASVMYALTGSFLLRKKIQWRIAVRRFFLPIMLVIVTIVVSRFNQATMIFALSAGLIWLLLFVILTMAGRCIEKWEASEIVQVLRGQTRERVKDITVFPESP